MPAAAPVRGSESMGPSLVQTGVSELSNTQRKSVAAGVDREESGVQFSLQLPLAQPASHRQPRVLVP